MPGKGSGERRLKGWGKIRNLPQPFNAYQDTPSATESYHAPSYILAVKQTVTFYTVHSLQCMFPGRLEVVSETHYHQDTPAGSDIFSVLHGSTHVVDADIPESLRILQSGNRISLSVRTRIAFRSHYETECRLLRPFQFRHRSTVRNGRKDIVDI